MSHAFNRSRWVGASITGLAVAAAISAAPAVAAFDPSFEDQCSGAALDGRGASFANSAQNTWIADFVPNVCGSTFTMTYNSASVLPLLQGQGETGSGAGRRAFGQTGGWNTNGVRHDNIRFAGTDEPSTASQEADMENGVNSPQVPGDDGVLRTIPITSGSVAMIVNFPDGCTIPADLRYRPAADQTTRFATDNALWEAAWAAEITTWGDLVPGIVGAGCSAKPIKRVARVDSSGTTFALKTWLNVVNPDRNWPSLYVDPNNIVWPTNATVLRGTATGNGALADKVVLEDGSIGYGDLATVRSKGFTKTPNVVDDTYWVPLQNGLGTFQDPQSFVDGYRNSDSSRRGANCSRATYSNVPGGGDPTAANWAAVEGVDSPLGYTICTLTYGLAWDDYCDVYGSTNAEQARARSAFDYYGYVTSSAAQSIARAADYSPLPSALLATAQTGAGLIGWRKAGGSCS